MLASMIKLGLAAAGALALSVVSTRLTIARELDREFASAAALLRAHTDTHQLLAGNAR